MKTLNQNQIRVAHLSGGKDSSAMAALLEERFPGETTYMTQDVLFEWPDKRAILNQLEKTLGIHIYHIDLVSLSLYNLKRWGWPTPNGLWCTSIKRDKGLVLANKLKPTRGIAPVEAVGIRADEPRRIRTRTTAKRSLDYPLVDFGWGKKEVEACCDRLGLCWEFGYPEINSYSCFTCPRHSLAMTFKLWKSYPWIIPLLISLDGYRTTKKWRMEGKNLSEAILTFQAQGNIVNLGARSGSLFLDRLIDRSNQDENIQLEICRLHREPPQASPIL